MSHEFINNIFTNVSFYFDYSKYDNVKLIKCFFSKFENNNFLKIEIKGELLFQGKNDEAFFLLRNDRGCTIGPKTYDAALMFCELFREFIVRNKVDEIICYAENNILFKMTKSSLIWNGNHNEDFVKICNKIIKLFVFN